MGQKGIRYEGKKEKTRGPVGEVYELGVESKTKIEQRGRFNWKGKAARLGGKWGLCPGGGERGLGKNGDTHLAVRGEIRVIDGGKTNIEKTARKTGR